MVFLSKKSEYALKLRDPRWQKKRLGIMHRDEDTCQHCFSTEKLQVHHKRYYDGLDPWEYDDNDLITLCDYCQKAEHERQELVKQAQKNRKTKAITHDHENGVILSHVLFEVICHIYGKHITRKRFFGGAHGMV